MFINTGDTVSGTDFSGDNWRWGPLIGHFVRPLIRTAMLDGNAEPSGRDVL